jgi:hypothetical protein
MQNAPAVAPIVCRAAVKTGQRSCIQAQRGFGESGNWMEKWDKKKNPSILKGCFSKWKGCGRNERCRNSGIPL